ncbi:MAG: MCP four helix bundle domain-containing protein [Holophaga sp.]|jgi:methyl-accepting chemotaxis protein
MATVWFANLPVKRKILLVVGSFSAILLFMLALAVLDVRAAQARTEAMYRDDLMAVGALTQARTGLDEFAGQTRGVAAATVEQARAGADVARQVDAGSQEAAAVAAAVDQMSLANQEVARTASELTRLADSLRRQVAQFRT